MEPSPSRRDRCDDQSSALAQCASMQVGSVQSHSRTALRACGSAGHLPKRVRTLREFGQLVVQAARRKHAAVQLLFADQRTEFLSASRLMRPAHGGWFAPARVGLALQLGPFFVSWASLSGRPRRDLRGWCSCWRGSAHDHTTGWRGRLWLDRPRCPHIRLRCRGRWCRCGHIGGRRCDGDLLGRGPHRLVRCDTRRRRSLRREAGCLTANQLALPIDPRHPGHIAINARADKNTALTVDILCPCEGRGWKLGRSLRVSQGLGVPKPDRQRRGDNSQGCNSSYFHHIPHKIWEIRCLNTRPE